MSHLLYGHTIEKDGGYKRPEEIGTDGIYLDMPPNPIGAPIDSSAGTLKFREGKYDPSLVPPMFIRVLSRVFEYGLKKYHRDSWRKFTIEQAEADLIPAAMRHIDDYRQGITIDPESKLPTLACAAWNCLVVLWHGQPDKDAYK